MSNNPLLPLSQTGRAILTALQQHPDGLSRYGLVHVVETFADKSILRMLSTLQTQGFVQARVDDDHATRFTITEAGVERLQTSPQPRLNPLERDSWTPQPWMHPFRQPMKRKPLATPARPSDPTTMKHPVYPPRKLPAKPPVFLEIPDATP